MVVQKILDLKSGTAEQFKEIKMKYLFPIFAFISLASCNTKTSAPDFNIEFGKVAKHSVFDGGDSLSHWGGSVVKGKDGLYHMFYSRGPKQIGWEWANYSEIAHATSESIFGPYEHVDVTLPERGAEFWDGSATHNPTSSCGDEQINTGPERINPSSGK